MSQIQTKYIADLAISTAKVAALAITNAKIANATLDLTTKVTGALPIGNAGTNITTYTTGDILYASATNVLSKLPIGSSTNVLTVSGGIPAWSAASAGTVTSVAMTVPTFLSVAGSPITTSGTLAVTLSGTALPILNGGTGATTKTAAFDNLSPMTTGGDIIYGGASGTGTRLANGTSGQVLQSSGTTAAPVWATVPGNTTVLKAPTLQSFTSTGTQTGWLFTISTSTTCAVGDTYTNNSNTYTVRQALSAQSGQVLWMSGTGATSGTTLTRSAGAGTSSITFSVKIATATYTTPSSPGPISIFVEVVGGGGGGGGCASAVASCGAGGGGGGAAYCYKLIGSPISSYDYVVGTGGAGGVAGNNAGTGGVASNFMGSQLIAGGGSGGGGSGAATAISNGGTGSAGGTSSGGDANLAGCCGSTGLILTPTAIAISGQGGASGAGWGGSSLSNVDVTATGNGGQLYGGGASGGLQVNNGGAQAGGAGSNGIIVVREYYQ